MDIKIRAIALLLFMLEVLVLVQAVEAYSVEHKNKEACDSMLVSHAGIAKGKTIFVQHNFWNMRLQILVEAPSNFKVLENC